MITIIIISLAIIGIHSAMQVGGILSPLRQLSEKYLPAKIAMPVSECIPCMASLWGTALYLLINYGGIAGQYITYICAISGVLYLICLTIINKHEL